LFLSVKCPIWGKKQHKGKTLTDSCAVLSCTTCADKFIKMWRLGLRHPSGTTSIAFTLHPQIGFSISFKISFSFSQCAKHGRSTVWLHLLVTNTTRAFFSSYGLTGIVELKCDTCIYADIHKHIQYIHDLLKMGLCSGPTKGSVLPVVEDKGVQVILGGDADGLFIIPKFNLNLTFLKTRHCNFKVAESKIKDEIINCNEKKVAKYVCIFGCRKETLKANTR